MRKKLIETLKSIFVKPKKVLYLEEGGLAFIAFDNNTYILYVDCLSDDYDKVYLDGWKLSMLYNDLTNNDYNYYHLDYNYDEDNKVKAVMLYREDIKHLKIILKKLIHQINE